eukprot:2249147-Amphidinium_carterae.2
MGKRACADVQSVPVASVDGNSDDFNKKRGPILCTACKRKLDKTAWGATQVRAGQEQPTGDKCMSCLTCWQKGFSWMSWDSWCEHQQTKENSC